MLNTNDYYAKLHIMSKRKIKDNLEGIIKIQKNNLHNKDSHVMNVRVKKIIPCETMNPSFFKFEVSLSPTFIQNNHNKVVYAISIWDRKTNKLIKASNFKPTNMYVISKLTPSISFTVQVEF